MNWIRRQAAKILIWYYTKKLEAQYGRESIPAR